MKEKYFDIMYVKSEDDCADLMKKDEVGKGMVQEVIIRFVYD